MTHGTSRLPVRPHPADGELAIGYLNRLALANGYQDARFMCRALTNSKRPTLKTLPFDSGVVHRLFGVLPRFGNLDFSTTLGIPPEHFNHHYIRWCPLCLSAQGYFFGVWGLKLCCACIRHGTQLVDECPSCRQRQGILRCLPVCRLCGQDLSRATAPAATESLVELHAHLELSIQECRQTGEPRSVLDWLRLIKFLGPFFSDPWHRRPGQAANLHCLPCAVLLAEGAASLLANWPEYFDALLSRARADRPEATHLQQAYGPLYRVLYRDLAAAWFDPLRVAFEQHLHEHWFGLLGRQNRWLRSDTICRHPRRAESYLKDQTGVGAAAVRHLADGGAISVHATRHKSGRVSRAFHVAEIRHIERMNQNRLTLREAASLMQIGRQRVRELIDADVLHTWIDRRRVSASTWWLSKADVLHVATIGRTADRSVADYAWIDLALVLKTWRLRRGEFPALVRALLAEEVRARRPTEYATGLGHIELPVGELKTWLRSRRQEGTSSLSVDEAAKRLGLKQQVAYELVERGLIPVSGPRGARRVDPKGIDAFRRTYISLAELAKSQSVSPRGLLAILPNQPICGPSIDGARQYFYRRDEVARFQGLPFVP